MHKGFEGKIKPIIVFLKQFVSAILLLVVAYVFKIFLLPGNALYEYIFDGVWDPASHLESLQFSDTLESIALSRIIVAIIYYLMTRRKGLKRIYINIAIFGVLCILIIVLRPLMVQWIFNATGYAPIDIDDVDANTWKERLYLIFLGNLVGWQEPLFPFLSSALFGAMYGIIFGQKWLLRKKFMRISFFISLGFVIVGLGLLPFTENIIDDFWTHLHATWMLFVNLGVQSMCFLFFMRLIEFNPNNEKIVRRLRFFRRFGMLSLSIFCMELVDLIPRWIFTQIFGINLITGTTGNMGIILLLVLATLGFWYGLIRLWEFARFYGSLEVFVRLFTGLLFWKKPNFKDPLNSQKMLYNVEVFTYADNPTEAPQSVK